MNEDRTAQTNDNRPFEERVLAKFDLIDERFDGLIIRLGKLEERQYDTKPIWERALAAIVGVQAELKSINSRLAEMDQRFEAIDNRFDGIDKRFDGIDERSVAIEKRFDAVDARFDKQDEYIEHQFRKVKRRLEALNETLMEIRVDQRYVVNRLEKIEEKVFPDECN